MRILGELPPIVLATLRRRMIALAGEIADGMVFANGSRSHMAQSLAALPLEKRVDPAFFIGNRIRTCVSGDLGEARAVLRRAMTHYALLPYYRNYWKEAGYTDTRWNAVERAVAEGRETDIPPLSDRSVFSTDVTLCGTAAQVRDAVAGARPVLYPVLVPLSADGDQITALREIFEAFA